MLTLITSRILLSKVVAIIHPIIQIFYLRKFIIGLVKTPMRVIGFSCPENSFRNIMFLVTMGTNMKSLSHVVTYALESDDAT